MKKILTLFILSFVMVLPAFSGTDRTSEEYLKSKRHILSMNIAAEKVVKTAIKRSLKKEAPGKYKVKFKGYTLSSLRAGIFKYIEITGKNVVVKGIDLPYFNAKSVTDYNRIDYNQHPIVFLSDMEFDCILHLSEKSINDALDTEEYIKVLRKINTKAYPLFTINKVKVKIRHNKIYIIMSYNFPLKPRDKDRTFVVSSGVKVVNNYIKACDVSFDEAYGNLPMKKVINLINLLNPLNFTVNLVDSKYGEVKVKEIKILDDIVVVNGKMYIKGENK